MLFRLILPTLFVLTTTVGIGFLLNGLAGLFLKRAFGPEPAPVDRRIKFIIIRGREAGRWGMICLLAALPFLIVGLIGMAAIMRFMHSPALVAYLIPPPENNVILYSYMSDNGFEVAYGFDAELEEIYRHYIESLRDDGWEILRDTPISIVARRGGQELQFAFIGYQTGDKREYKAKVIVSYRQGP